MPNLSEQDYQKILTFLQGLHAHQSFEGFANYVRATIPQLVPAEFSVFTTIDFEARQLVGIGPMPYIPDMDEIMEHHFHKNPFAKHYVKTLDFSAHKLSDFMTEEQLHQSEVMYHRFMHYLDAEDSMVLSLPHAPVSTNSDNRKSHTANIVVDSISLLRGERSFTDRDRTILNLLQPHLMQARQTAQSFSQVVQNQQNLQDCLNTSGSIVLGSEGHISWITRKAERLLKQYFPTFNHLHTLPERLKQWANYQRSLLSKHNHTLKPLSPLKIEQSDRLLNVRFAADPGKDQYMLLLSEQKSPSLSIELLATLGLSTREAEILFWVMDGKTNAEIADTLYLSISTVRKHLEHIYLKLGAHTRAGAVVRAFKQLGVLNLDCSTIADGAS
jgi:DNA-binding CsgD family transcriptional regulator